MIPQLPHNILLSLFLILINLYGYSQDYSKKATLAKVEKDGFYSIVLTPEITSQVQDNFSDIRILNTKNLEIPYIIGNEEAKYSSTAFVEYPIVEKKIVPNCCTSIIIENTDKQSINNLSLEVKNSDAAKPYEILGSDDKLQWFGIKSTYIFENESYNSNSTHFSVINFPISDYNFFKIQLADSAQAPLNILRVGYFDTKVAQGKFIKVNSPIISQLDSAKDHKSYIKLLFNAGHKIDRIEFQIEGPKFYARQATLAAEIKHKNGKKYYETLAQLDLNSSRPHTYDLPNTLKQKEMYLIIDNEDNIPLKVTSVKAYQLTHYLKAYLSKDVSYNLVFGNAKAKTPHYDLEYFMDSIPGILPDVKLGSITSTIASANQKVTEVKWYENKIFIWVALLVVIVLMAFMAYTMMQELGNKKPV